MNGITYGDVFHRNEVEQSTYNFEVADIDMLFQLFDIYEKEAIRVAGMGYVLPAYDYVLKCSHTFNLLGARGAISVSERTAYIGRVRNLAASVRRVISINGSNLAIRCSRGKNYDKAFVAGNRH